ncbi:uncharacterized protein [Dysidea avara]|uniref:uncharacterized protein n=1 Tax=Dysidea avara TaxID=196820 RepID=UPI00331EAF8E
MAKQLLILLFLVMIMTMKRTSSMELNYPDIPVTYKVIINERDRANCPLAGNTTSPGKLRLVIPQGTSGIELMEAAVAQNKDFRFTVSFNNAGLGYSVQSINGVTRDLDNSCFWTLSFKPYLATKLKSSPVGISSYYPSFKAVVQWEYRRFQHDDK